MGTYPSDVCIVGIERATPHLFFYYTYFEEALTGEDRPDCTLLLVELQRLDDLLNKENH